LDAFPPVLVVTGPTASGKSDVAFQCALELDAEIISADSRQIYKAVSIGTAKPPMAMRERVRHHFVDEVGLDETYAAGRFADEAGKRIREILARGHSVVVVGGSGLYIRALTGGMFEGAYSDPKVRAALQDELQRSGSEALHRELTMRDPVLAAVTPAHNPHRLIRALEVCRVSGRPFSELRTRLAPRPRYRFMQTAIDWNREALYARIDERVDRMLEAGLVDEVRRILRTGTDPSVTALNTVGYKEVICYLDGAMTYSEMRAKIQQHTRNFAKRQLTWFRKESGLRWYPAASEAELPAIAERMCVDFRSMQAIQSH
jgi:tRNA dimethylallyltransferase